MGDPKKHRKKYETPLRPWDEIKIDEEREILKSYGLKNKKEIWKMSSLLKKFKVQARRLIASTSKQAELEKKQLIDSLVKRGFVENGASISNILELTLKDVLERRLQTQLYRKGFVKSIKQARQFITHNHIFVNNKLVNSPARIILANEEIGFSTESALNSAEHPERIENIKKDKGIKDIKVEEYDNNKNKESKADGGSKGGGEKPENALVEEVNAEVGSAERKPAVEEESKESAVDENKLAQNFSGGDK